MNYDISVLIPGIRTNRWLENYNSLKLACKNYKWQLVYVSPFGLPAELVDKPNIKLVKDYGNVVRCVQRGVLECDADLFFLTVDDCYFAEDSLDAAIDQFKEQCRPKDILAVRYGEGGDKQDESYWTCARHADFWLPGIDRSWKIANQPLMSRQRWIEVGGLECSLGYEYLDKPIHSLMFRLQRDRSNIVISKHHACIASWWPDCKGDHASVHWAQVSNDGPIFQRIYSNPDKESVPIKVNYSDWELISEVWQRRFSKGKYESYGELCQKEGYIIP